MSYSDVVDFITDAPRNSLMDSTMSPKGENSGRVKNWGTLFNLQHFGGRGACWSFEMGTRKNDNQVNYSHEPAKN
jgi:hypothetical protein